MATTPWARMRGLHAYPPLSRDTGLCLTPCNAVHTLGMAYAIDVVFWGGSQRVLRHVEHMVPGRLAFCPGAVAVVELPAGYCRAWPDFEQHIRVALELKAPRLVPPHSWRRRR